MPVNFPIALQPSMQIWRVICVNWGRAFNRCSVQSLLSSTRPPTSRVGSVGDSYDNALAETIKGLYKAELIWRKGPWRSFEAVEFATLEWVA